MVKTVDTAMDAGDELVVRDRDALTVTVERCGVGYAVVAKSPATGAVLFSEFVPSESIGA